MTMYRGRNGPTVYVDVDETLVLWAPPPGVVPAVPALPMRVWPHHEHIWLVRSLHAVGYTVVVWSRGGAEWAAKVVTALKLDDAVDVVLGKPELWIDDLSDPGKVLEPSRRRYLGTPPPEFPGGDRG